MLDTLSRYVYEVYRCKSVSEASKKLFISQPALSASIKKAEEKLGYPIFNRSTLPFSLTPEGKVYIKGIEEIIKIEEETRNSIIELSDLKSGTLTIGTATHISFFAIPIICREFKKTYPNVDINIVFGSTENLPSLLEKGTVDMIFTSIDSEYNYLNQCKLFEERCIIAVSRSTKETDSLSKFALSYDEVISRNYPDEKKLSDLSLFRTLEFVYSPPGSNLYKKRRLFLGDSSLSRHITSSSSKFQLNYNLMRAGLGALFTTDSALATVENTRDCLFFVIDSPDATQYFSILHSTPEDSRAYKAISEFISTASSLFHTDDPLSVLGKM